MIIAPPDGKFAQADITGQSRSVCADRFRLTVGATPGVHQQGWRARRSRPLNMIAIEVGYGSETALSRTFKAQTGMSPCDWR